MRTFSHFVCVVVLTSLACVGRADPAPPELTDKPFESKVVFGIRHPLAQHFSVLGGVDMYYGDRLASTHGLDVEARYFSSERIFWALSYSQFASSSLTDSSYTGATAIDPSSIIAAKFGYMPVYGKFALGDSIYHLRAGLVLGLDYVKWKQVSGYPGSEVSGLSLSEHAGLVFLIQPPSYDHLYFEIHTDLIAAGLGTANSTIGHRIDWVYGLRVGWMF